MTTDSTPVALGSNDQLGDVAEARCMCKDRAHSACPGEWEPGCDLGANPAHVRVSAPLNKPRKKLWLCECRMAKRTSTRRFNTEAEAMAFAGKQERVFGWLFKKWRWFVRHDA